MLNGCDYLFNNGISLLRVEGALKVLNNKHILYITTLKVSENQQQLQYDTETWLLSTQITVYR